MKSEHIKNSTLALLEEELRNQEEKFNALLKIAATLRSHRNPKIAMKAMMEQISSLLNAERTTIYELRDEVLVGIAVQGELSVDVQINKGQGIAGTVAATGKAIILKDAYLSKQFDRSFDQATGFRTGSVLCVPMINAQNECIGVVQVLNKRNGDFLQEDQILLTALAAQAGISLEALRLENALTESNEHLQALSRRLERRLEAQELLFEIEKLQSTVEDMVELSNQVLCKAAKVLNCDMVALFVTENQSYGPAYLRSAKCMSAVHAIPKVEVGEGILGKAASRSDVLNLKKADFDREAIPKQLCDSFAYPIDNIIACPMIDGENSVGSLVFINRNAIDEENEEEDLQFAVLLSRQFARGITLLFKRKSEQQRDRLMTIGQMMSGVVHDLKGLMTSISGFSQLMVQMNQQKDRQNASEFIKRKIEEFNAMTKEIMTFAKGEGTHLSEKVYLNQFAQELLLTLKHEFDEHNMEFKVIWEDKKDVAYFNKVKMMRVVMNIARNARQAMGKGGCFEWRIHRGKNNQLVFEFRDNGPGIPASIQEKVFDLFTTSGKKDGTGLGLAIVKRMIDDHEGEIQLFSEEGKGTTFIVTLPQAESNAPKAIAYEELL